MLRRGTLLNRVVLIRGFTTQSYRTRKHPFPASLAACSSHGRVRIILVGTNNPRVAGDESYGKNNATIQRPWTTNEAADFLGIHPRTVTRMARAGHLPGSRIGSLCDSCLRIWTPGCVHRYASRRSLYPRPQQLERRLSVAAKQVSIRNSRTKKAEDRPRRGPFAFTCETAMEVSRYSNHRLGTVEELPTSADAERKPRQYAWGSQPGVCTGHHLRRTHRALQARQIAVKTILDQEFVSVVAERVSAPRWRERTSSRSAVRPTSRAVVS